MSTMCIHFLKLQVWQQQDPELDSDWTNLNWLRVSIIMTLIKLRIINNIRNLILPQELEELLLISEMKSIPLLVMLRTKLLGEKTLFALLKEPISNSLEIFRDTDPQAQDTLIFCQITCGKLWKTIFLNLEAHTDKAALQKCLFQSSSIKPLWLINLLLTRRNRGVTAAKFISVLWILPLIKTTEINKEISKNQFS